MIGNISSTVRPPKRFAAYRLSILAAGALGVATLVWGAWATHQIRALSTHEVVTVQLASVMGEFVEAEARNHTDPEASRQRIARYLAAVDDAVQAMGKDGATVLVAEAVVAGSARDATPELRSRVARHLAQSQLPGGDNHSAGERRRER